jgi:translation initiation factor IF-1
VIVEALSERLCRVEFKNGHRLLAHLAGRRVKPAGLKAGDKVTVEMSPFDFSRGRILLNEP